MKKRNGHANSFHCQNERGAALITTLLIATLLLGAGLSVVMTTSMSSTTAIDSTAEMQAYFAAEAGMEATLNVLRGNVTPDASLAGTKINFRNAANPPTSDKTSDTWRTGASAVARLSGWLNYSYQASADDWRVPVTSSYNPLTGIAYKIVISDPDDPGPITTRKITTDLTYKPSRLLIKSEGYGPKGAIKRLEMIIKSSAFDVPAAMTLQCGPSVNLSLGDSADSRYTGNDMAIPPQPGKSTIATCPGSTGTTQGVIDGMIPGQVTPSPATALSDTNTPGFLATADACRAFLYDPITGMRPFASRIGRLFPTKALALLAGGLGTTASPKFTFIDNYGTTATPGPAVDLGTGHQGSGILIVTGEVTTTGNTDFEGVILVLGRGKITRTGGGDGVIRGAVIVANFDPNGAPGTGFGTPTYSIGGGGESIIGYDSKWVKDALSMTGAFVVGVREYH
jgi:hypothetical protein